MINFGEERILNAKIKFSWLGLEENGSLMFQLGFDCENAKTFTTNKTPISIDQIKILLNVLELRSWEELPRKFARVKLYGTKVVGIGNLIENKWVEL